MVACRNNKGGVDEEIMAERRTKLPIPTQTERSRVMGGSSHHPSGLDLLKLELQLGLRCLET
jgi:hypothetical protein